MRRVLGAVVSCCFLVFGCGAEDDPRGGTGGDVGGAGTDVGGAGTHGGGGGTGGKVDTSWILEPVEACPDFENQKASNPKVPATPEAIGAFPPLSVGFKEKATVTRSSVGRLGLRTEGGLDVELRWHESALSLFELDQEVTLEQTRDWTILRMGTYYVLALHGAFGAVGAAELEPIAHGQGLTRVHYEMQCNLVGDGCQPQAVAAVVSRGEESARAISGLGKDVGQNQNVWTLRHLSLLEDETCKAEGPRFRSMMVVEGLWLTEEG